QDGADEIESARVERVPVERQRPPTQQGGSDRDRNVHPEYGPPPDAGDQRPTQDEPGDEPYGARRAVQAERAVPSRSLGERGGEKGERGRCDHGRPDPLSRSGRDQGAGRAREPPQEGGRREREQTGEKQPPPTEKVSHRSEEHTSELQSLAYLVCRLLLEK